MNIQACLTSNSNEWATPQKFYEELDAEFHFDLDPCATPENAKCKRFFTIEDDGLKQNWGGGQECSAIPRMGGKSASGSRSVTRKVSRAPSALCSFPQGQIPRGFGTISTIKQKYDS